MRKFHRGYIERERELDDEFLNNRFCNVGAAAVMAIGGVVAGSMASDGASAQAAGLQANAASTTEVAKIQAQTASEYLDFQKQQYADLKPLAEQVSKAQVDTMKQQTAIAASNEQRAQEYSDYEKSTYRPLEQGIVDQANNFDTAAKREELARQGMADVSAAYEQQRQQALDTMSRYGINPNSNRFAAINAQLSNSEAAAKAGVATNAATNAEQLGWTRKLDAASLGRNLASNASTAYGIATTAGNSSVNSGTAALTSAYTPGNTMSSGYANFNTQLGNASNSYYGAGNLYGTGYKIASAAESASAQGFGNILGQFVGSKAGSSLISNGISKIFAADGGAIHRGPGDVSGPGGPVDDKVPAMLSDGEYVLPADTVKAIGKDKLDKIIASTHTPAAQQRRKGISTRG